MKSWNLTTLIQLAFFLTFFISNLRAGPLLNNKWTQRKSILKDRPLLKDRKPILTGDNLKKGAELLTPILDGSNRNNRPLLKDRSLRNRDGLLSPLLKGEGSLSKQKDDSKISTEVVEEKKKEEEKVIENKPNLETKKEDRLKSRSEIVKDQKKAEETNTDQEVKKNDNIPQPEIVKETKQKITEEVKSAPTVRSNTVRENSDLDKENSNEKIKAIKTNPEPKNVKPFSVASFLPPFLRNSRLVKNMNMLIGEGLLGALAEGNGMFIGSSKSPRMSRDELKSLFEGRPEIQRMFEGPLAPLVETIVRAFIRMLQQVLDTRSDDIGFQSIDF